MVHFGHGHGVPFVSPRNRFARMVEHTGHHPIVRKVFVGAAHECCVSKPGRTSSRGETGLQPGWPSGLAPAKAQNAISETTPNQPMECFIMPFGSTQFVGSPIAIA